MLTVKILSAMAMSMLFSGLVLVDAGCSRDQTSLGVPTGDAPEMAQITDMAGMPTVDAADQGVAPDLAAPPQTFTRIRLDMSGILNGTILSAQFSTWVTFSTSDPARPNIVERYGSKCGFKDGKDFYACAGTACVSPPATVLDFTRPVRNFSIGVGGINLPGTEIAKVVVFQGSTQLGVVPVVSSMNCSTGYGTIVDLSAYKDISRVSIEQITDLYGIDFGDVSFDFPQS